MSTDPSIFDYTDFRAYLRAWFVARNGRPSQSAFSRRVPCSASLLSSVLHGTRNLGRARAERVAKALKLSEEEREFFLTLVTFAEAESPKDREQAWGRIQARRHWNDAARLEDDAYEVFGNWLYAVLFEMARWPDFQADPMWIGERVRPRVERAEIERALDFLIERGLLVDGGEGFSALNARLSSGHEELDPFRGHLLARYHQEHLDLARERLTQTYRASRHYVTMTFATDEAGVKAVSRQIRSVIEVSSDRAMNCESPDRVMVLAIQLVPVASAEPSSERDDA